MMRNLTAIAFLCGILGMSPAAQAQTPDPQVMAPINKFMSAFNQGDMTAAAATHASGADLVIIDEVPPFVWRGAKAFQAWADDLAANDKKRGATDQKVTLGKATRIETEGDAAYVVAPATYTFKEGGVAMRETAQMTFALKKGAGGWLIHGWTWTGQRPQKAMDSSKK